MSRVGGTFRNWDKAGRALSRDIELILKDLEVEMRDAIKDDLMPILRRRTPVATSLSSGSVANYPGEMRDKWQAIPGAPPVGTGTIIVNAAPHAAIVDAGFAGPKQGVTVPSLRELEGDEDGLVRQVIREVERRLG